MTGYAGSRVYVGNLSLREEPHTDPHLPLKMMIPTLSWKTLRVLCGCSVHGTRNERVGIIFFSGMFWSVWGSPRRLQVPYVIPRPGVTRHMLSRLGLKLPQFGSWQCDRQGMNWQKCLHRNLFCSDGSELENSMIALFLTLFRAKYTKHAAQLCSLVSSVVRFFFKNLHNNTV